MSNRGRSDVSGMINKANVCAPLEGLKKKKPMGKSSSVKSGAEKAVEEQRVFWAPAPLNSKSWADVDDNDYCATTDPPQAVWGSTEQQLKDERLMHDEVVEEYRDKCFSSVEGKKKIDEKYNKKSGHGMEFTSADVEHGAKSGGKKKLKENKKNRRHEVSYGDSYIDILSDTKSLMGSVEIDTRVKKKKKKKRHELANEIASEHVEREPINVVASLEVDNGVKKMKKKKSHEPANHIASLDVQTKTRNVVGFLEADTGNLPSRSIGIIVEKDADKKVKKTKVASNDLKGYVGEDKCEAKEKNSCGPVEKEVLKKVKKRKRNVNATDSSKKSKSKRKRVSFSDNVEVFPLPEHLRYRKLNSEGVLVQGKRYTPEEDVKIMQAVDDFILERGLASDGVDKDLDENWKKARSMIINCKAHPEFKGCWKDISAALPWRTVESIYQRAHLVYERAEERKWTKEEIDMILSFHEKNGPKWRELGDFLGKSRKHVKDAYRRNKLRGEIKGAWSQEEYQKLFELVNHDICIKALQEKKVKHGMLRDNIAWGAISESIGTRASPTCCNKWYYQLCSSMVVEGKWSDTDDYKLVDALYNHDACCIEDVEWNSLLEHRSGDLCQKRWAEMARNLGEYRLKPFLEQVEVLHQRYNQGLIGAREMYEKKDPVDV